MSRGFKNMTNTLVSLMEWSHIAHMMGDIREKTHQDIYVSWQKITKSYYDTLDLENKTRCINCNELVLDCLVRCPFCCEDNLK